MSIARIQSNNASSGTTVTSLAITLSSGVTLGNLLVVCLGYGSATNTVTLPDGSWQTAVDSPGAANEQSAEIYSLLVDAGHAGQTSWTFTFSSSCKPAITIAEWSSSTGWASPTVDQTATNTATSTATTIDSGTTATTTQASELWVAALSYGQSAQTESGLTAGWSLGQEAAITSAHVLREVYQAVSSTGVADASFTIAVAQHWGGCVATFKVLTSATVGQITGATDITRMRLGTQTLADAEALVRFSVTAPGDVIGIALRDTALNNYVRVRHTSAQLQVIQQTPTGGLVVLASYAVGVTAGVWYWLKFRALGVNLYGKLWQDGTAEPANWLVSGLTTVLAAGQVGLSCSLAAALDIAAFDSFRVTGASTSGLLPNTQAKDIALRAGIVAALPSVPRLRDVALRAGVADVSSNAVTVTTYAAKRPPLLRRFPKS